MPTPPGHDVPSSRESPAQRRKGLRVLLAEDNPIDQNVAERLLQKRGHVVTVVSNGQEALAALENSSFDIVLMDVQMPVMDGFEATLAIREREKETGKHIPILAITTDALKGRCLRMGMDAYISKPIYFQDFFRAIEQLCGGET